MKKYKVAVMGATGAVGREMLKTLAEREFPVGEVYRAGLGQVGGQRSEFRRRRCPDRAGSRQIRFQGHRYLLVSAGAKVSAEFAPRAGKAGCVVIDKTSHFRMDPDVPLVVPEVNPEAIAGYTKTQHHRQRPIARPSRCWWRSSRCMIWPRSSASSSRPINRFRARARRRWMSCSRKRARFSSTTRSRKNSSRKQIAFNVIPQIDVFMEDGIDQGRMEDGGRDQENPRSQNQGHGHLRARAGFHRPCRSDQCRIRKADQRVAKRARRLQKRQA